LIGWARRLGIAALCSSCLLPRPVPGAEVRILPEVSVGVGYSDNAELARDGEEDMDQAALARIRALAGVNGPRGHLVGFGELGALKFARDPDRDDTRVNATGLGQVELLDEWLYMRGQGVVAEVFDNPLGGVSASPVNATRNRVKVKTYRVNPFVRHAFGGWTTVETGYTASGVNLGSGTAHGSFTNQFTAVAKSGLRFPTLSWSATLDFENTDRNNRNRPDEDSKRRLIAWDGSWATIQDLSLLGGFGYEDTRDDGLPDRIDGAVGYVGLAYEPNSRTFLSATAGRRFDRSVFSADAHVELGPRTRIRMGYEESLQTTQRLIRTGLGFLGTDPDGNPIDDRSGRPLVVGDPAFGLIEGTFYQKRVSTALERVSDRLEFDLELYGEERDFELRGAEDDAIGVNTSLKRWLNRRTSVDLELRYWRVKFRDRSDTDRQILARFGFTRHLSSSLALTATYYLSRRNAADDARDLQENSIVFGVEKRFGGGLRESDSLRSRRLPRPQTLVTRPEARR
jgi:hypothetical protein